MKERESTDSVKRSASGDGCVHSLPGLQRMVGEVMRGLEDLWGLETWFRGFLSSLKTLRLKYVLLDPTPTWNVMFSLF